MQACEKRRSRIGGEGGGLEEEEKANTSGPKGGGGGMVEGQTNLSCRRTCARGAERRDTGVTGGAEGMCRGKCAGDVCH